MRIWNCTYRGGSVDPNPRLQETLPRHADMLRYDGAFCDPADMSRVILPIFQIRGLGTTPGHITWDRWKSFGLLLIPTEEQLSSESIVDWFTYVRVPPDCSTLVKETFKEWCARHKITKVIGDMR